MPYLICDKCNVSYKIENEKEMEDFNVCKCGNKLKYYNTLDEYMNEGEDKAETHFKYSKEGLLLITNTLREDHERDHEDHLQRERNYQIRHSTDEEKIYTDGYESQSLKN